MSRIGKYPVILKSGIKVAFNDDFLTITGNNGSIKSKISDKVNLEITETQILVNPANDSLDARKLWGTTKALINNMVLGVSEGFKIVLDINGVGYRASIQGKNLVLQLGFSHDIIFPIPEDVKLTCPDQTHIVVEGIDKQRVGQVAAKIREFKKPEPYKGKGIKYSDEVILRKEGKKK